MYQHLKSPEDSEEQEQLYGNLSAEIDSQGNLLLKALKNLQKNKKDPQVVAMSSKIVNKAFPQFEKVAKQLAKKLNF